MLQLWQWVGTPGGPSVTLFGELPPNRTQTMTRTHSGASELAQLMEGTSGGALIPEIVRRGFQVLLEAPAKPSPKELFRPLPVLNSMSAVLISGPPTVSAIASGCSPPR